MSGAVAQAVVRQALIWLAKCGEGVSKHVGKHTRSVISAARNRPWILERSLHGVFRSPNPKKLVQRALKSFDLAVVQNHSGHIKVLKTFESVIGRAGERTLVIWIRANGAIISAYPVHIAEAAVSGTALILLEGKIIEALDGFERISVQHQETKKQMDAHEGFIVKLIDFLLFDSAVANEDEGLYIAQGRFHQLARAQYLSVAQDLANRSFGPDELTTEKQRFDDGLGGAAAAYLDYDDA